MSPAPVALQHGDAEAWAACRRVPEALRAAIEARAAALRLADRALEAGKSGAVQRCERALAAASSERQERIARLQAECKAVVDGAQAGQADAGRLREEALQEVHALRLGKLEARKGQVRDGTVAAVAELRGRIGAASATVRQAQSLAAEAKRASQQHGEDEARRRKRAEEEMVRLRASIGQLEREADESRRRFAQEAKAEGAKAARSLWLRGLAFAGLAGALLAASWGLSFREASLLSWQAGALAVAWGLAVVGGVVLGTRNLRPWLAQRRTAARARSLALQMEQDAQDRRARRIREDTQALEAARWEDDAAVPKAKARQEELDAQERAAAAARDTAAAKGAKALAGLLADLQAEGEAAMQRLRQRAQDATAACDGEVRRVEEEHRERQGRARAEGEEEAKEALRRHAAAVRTAQERWSRDHAQAAATVAAVEAAVQRSYPSWEVVRSGKAGTAVLAPSLVPFGLLAMNVPTARGSKGEGGTTVPFLLPAALAVPRELSVLIETQGPAAGPPIETLNLLLLRLLAGMPPGKVRFTMVDPLGLGDNFATFMHLGDFDETLVTGKIWTDERHIEEQLGRIIEHIELVIQKYLRGRYETIEEYNEQAGEVAEPYRFVVVADFPRRFSPKAAEDLLRIASSGKRCGVHVLLSRDGSQDLPRGFDLRALQQHFVRFRWDGKRCAWEDRELGHLPLALDAPPAPEAFQGVLEALGSRAVSSNRVQVPFAFVAPPPEQVWKGDSRHGLSIPIGRAGATKRQALELGQGTCQHVVMAGKTGSGKSTLLHAIITNAALQYPPSELELYLIDFKKGVEFKPYAEPAHPLPHAAVIAIESEREFALSVLQRLDRELKERGARFKERQAQNVAAYRDADPAARCPRILLVVDEFQEFFTQEDPIKQEAGLLLDRLVRQGRAFGIHVILGSQTLSGAYTVPDSTLSQMGVRIALQSSEADARRILSMDNPAARLLSRPGEAIYNDHNGDVEGNNPFQVVWLDDAERARRLQAIARMGPARPQVVFDGNALSDLGKNQALAALAADRKAGHDARAWRAWMGEAIAIKDPPQAVFRRLAGSNLLVVGQDGEAVLGITAAILLGLAAQARRAGSGPASILLVDGLPADAEHHGRLAGAAAAAGGAVQAVARRDLAPRLAELAAEVATRVRAADAGGFPARFLLVHGAQYLRDLRRQEEPFQRRGAEPPGPTPAADFQAILRDGAAVGVHVILCCDHAGTVQRTVERLREFALRAVLQMTQADAQTLTGTWEPSRLGPNRAFLYNDEQASFEKFRPYAPPSEAFLSRFAAAFSPGR